jgi:cobalt-zinc-cadmium efflux system membrane fusion protein
MHGKIFLNLAIAGWMAAGPGVVRGHEGHGGSELGPFDLDTPRVVTPETAAHIGLKTAEVDFGAVEEVLRLSGIVRASPDRHWTIATRTAGKVLSVHVQVGDRVTTGDLLVTIDSPELARNVYEARKLAADYQRLLVEIARSEGRIKQLRVDVENAEVAAELAEAELARSEAAGERVIPLNVLAERRSMVLKARGEARRKAVDVDVETKESEALRNLAAALRLSRDALLAMVNIEAGQGEVIEQVNDEASIHLVRLRAPADGVVVARSARAGHWATAGESLLEVADFSTVLIEGELPESLLGRMAARQSDRARIRIAADPTFVAEGRVRFISPVLDEVKRTAHVLVEAENPGALRGGMFADLAIVLREEPDAVVVPASAVIQDGPVHFVFVKLGDTYQKQDINPGIVSDEVVEVLDGLAPGDVVVSQGAYSLTQLRPKATEVATLNK